MDKKKEEIIDYQGRKLRIIEVLGSGKPKELIEFEKWSDQDYCLKAVENDGCALSYVKEQTQAICLKAVERDGDALSYVKEQTPAICLKAVENYGDALRYVREKATLLKILKQQKKI